MVSIWPTVDSESENYKQMELGYLHATISKERMYQLEMPLLLILPIRMPGNLFGDKIKKIIMMMASVFSGWMKAKPNSPIMNLVQPSFLPGIRSGIGNVFPREYARMAWLRREWKRQDRETSIVNPVSKAC